MTFLPAAPMSSAECSPLARLERIAATRFWQRLGGLLVRAPLAAGQAERPGLRLPATFL